MYFKRSLTSVALAASLTSLCPLAYAQGDKPAAAPTTTTTTTTTAPAAAANAAPADARSYALGVALADSVTTSYDGLKVDYKVLLEGFAAKVKGETLLMDDAAIQQEIEKVTVEAQEKMQADTQARMKQQETAMSAAGESNKAKGEKFLAENKGKPGVITTASGLQYKVEREGTGVKPKASDTVSAHYKGTLLDGKTFDSSYDRGEPLELPVGQVIPGWQEVLQLMSVGSKVIAWIPGDLAYGPRGAGGDIGPNETLVFEMELLSISK